MQANDELPPPLQDRIALLAPGEVLSLGRPPEQIAPPHQKWRLKL